MFHEADDPPPFDEAPAAQEVVDEALLDLTPAQRARRVQDDAGHWPTRAGSSRPPNVHPEVWQSLSAGLR
eukprot:14438162-Heterocapsa_arctica.AAC.1